MDGDYDDGLVDREGRSIPVSRPATRCRCGARTYATAEAATQAERSGADKCHTCHTFATDHAWRGDYSDPSDSANPRCHDCDIRRGSHR